MAIKPVECPSSYASWVTEAQKKKLETMRQDNERIFALFDRMDKDPEFRANWRKEANRKILEEVHGIDLSDPIQGWFKIQVQYRILGFSMWRDVDGETYQNRAMCEHSLSCLMRKHQDAKYRMIDVKCK